MVMTLGYSAAQPVSVWLHLSMARETLDTQMLRHKQIGHIRYRHSGYSQTGDRQIDTDRQETDTLDIDRLEVDTEDSDGLTDTTLTQWLCGSVCVGVWVGGRGEGSLRRTAVD